MQWELTDAYAHVGLPRFGSLEQLLRFMDVHGIGQAAAVLGPLVPDIETLGAAARSRPDRLRAIGIPFGETEEQRLEAVRLQLEAGAIGIRLEHREAPANRRALALIGEAGRWAYGIDACRDQHTAALYLDWLDRYPAARLASPHFAYAHFPAADGERTGGHIERLMRHPRFCGILVRNLGMGGVADPHEAFKAWISYALEQCGPERLLWGSEYPVLFWRNERAADAVALFRELLRDCSSEQFAQIVGGNARRLLFAAPAPARRDVHVPAWIESQFPRNRKVPFFPHGLELETADYEAVLDRYMRSDTFARGGSMAEYMLERLKSDG